MNELAATLEGLAAFVRRHVVLNEAQLMAVVLWVAHTHALEAAEQSPYLAVTSATKRSGKSRLLDVLELLVARPWRLISPSEAVLFRKLDADKPTVLLDEADTIWNGKTAEEHQGLRAILNAGNRRGTIVPRCAGPQGTVLVDFHIFGAKALAGIGRLPETVADRSIPIRLRRKMPTERVERFRQREAEQAAEPLALSVASVMEQLVPALAEARPELPEELDDRAQDGWEPLLVIADAAEGEWPARARAAAVELSGERDDRDDAIALRLLLDIRTVYDAQASDRLATTALLEGLAEDEEAPWATWHRGEPMSPRALADLLRPFGISSRTVRSGHGRAAPTARGYYRESFEDAWVRYLHPESGSTPSSSEFPRDTPTHPGSVNGLRASTQVTHHPGVSDTQHAASPHEQRGVSVCRIETPNLERSGPRAAGDPHFLDLVRGAFRARHLTHSEYLERVAIHGVARRAW